MSKVGRWSTTPGSNNATPPDGWPEGQAPSTVNDCAREMMAQIRTLINDAQYVDQDFTPTYISATSFSVTGDQTSAIHAGRRLKIFDATAGAATTIYATVVTASYTTVTTVSISADAGQLTSSLSSFAIAILSNTNDSLPRKLAASYSAVTTDRLTINTTTTASGNVICKTNLTVEGFLSASTMQANTINLLSGLTAPTVTVTTRLSAPDVTVTGGVSAGNVTILGTLSVSGAAVLHSTLSVSGTVVAANVAKTWAKITTGNPPTIVSSFNVASVSRSAAGVFRINFSTAFADANYAYIISQSTPVFYQSESALAASLKFSTVLVGGTAVEGVALGFTAYR